MTTILRSNLRRNFAPYFALSLLYFYHLFQACVGAPPQIVADEQRVSYGSNALYIQAACIESPDRLGGIIKGQGSPRLWKGTLLSTPDENTLPWTLVANVTGLQPGPISLILQSGTEKSDLTPIGVVAALKPQMRSQSTLLDPSATQYVLEGTGFGTEPSDFKVILTSAGVYEECVWRPHSHIAAGAAQQCAVLSLTDSSMTVGNFSESWAPPAGNVTAKIDAVGEYSSTGIVGTVFPRVNFSERPLGTDANVLRIRGSGFGIGQVPMTLVLIGKNGPVQCQSISQPSPTVIDCTRPSLLVPGSLLAQVSVNGISSGRPIKVAQVDQLTFSPFLNDTSAAQFLSIPTTSDFNQPPSLILTLRGVGFGQTPLDLRVELSGPTGAACQPSTVVFANETDGGSGVAITCLLESRDGLPLRAGTIFAELYHAGRVASAPVARLIPSILASPQTHLAISNSTTLTVQGLGFTSEPFFNISLRSSDGVNVTCIPQEEAPSVLPPSTPLHTAVCNLLFLGGAHPLPSPGSSLMASAIVRGSDGLVYPSEWTPVATLIPGGNPTLNTSSVIIKVPNLNDDQSVDLFLNGSDLPDSVGNMTFEFSNQTYPSPYIVHLLNTSSDSFSEVEQNGLWIRVSNNPNVGPYLCAGAVIGQLRAMGQLVTTDAPYLAAFLPVLEDQQFNPTIYFQAPKMYIRGRGFGLMTKAPGYSGLSSLEIALTSDHSGLSGHCTPQSVFTFQNSQVLKCGLNITYSSMADVYASNPLNATIFVGLPNLTARGGGGVVVSAGQALVVTVTPMTGSRPYLSPAIDSQFANSPLLTIHGVFSADPSDLIVELVGPNGASGVTADCPVVSTTGKALVCMPLAVNFKMPICRIRALVWSKGLSPSSQMVQVAQFAPARVSVTASPDTFILPTATQFSFTASGVSTFNTSQSLVHITGFDDPLPVDSVTQDGVVTVSIPDNMTLPSGPLYARLEDVGWNTISVTSQIGVVGIPPPPSSTAIVRASLSSFFVTILCLFVVLYWVLV